MEKIYEVIVEHFYFKNLEQIVTVLFTSRNRWENPTCQNYTLIWVNKLVSARKGA